jgi:hypothetical protein
MPLQLQKMVGLRCCAAQINQGGAAAPPYRFRKKSLAQPMLEKICHCIGRLTVAARRITSLPMQGI